MRLVVTEFLSVDNVYEAPGSEATLGDRGGWTTPFGSPEFGEFKLEELMNTDAILLGKNTYDGFALAWPDRTDEQGFASRFNSLPKYVATHSDAPLSWNNSHSLHGDVMQEIRDLKAKPGRDLVVHGSGELVQQLVSAELIDEFRLMVFPVIVGAGKKLLAANGPKIGLELVISTQLPHGVIIHTYKPSAT